MDRETLRFDRVDMSGWRHNVKCPDCNERSPHFRFSIAGYPVLNDHNEPVLVCETCADRMKTDWKGALET